MTTENNLQRVLVEIDYPSNEFINMDSLNELSEKASALSKEFNDKVNKATSDILNQVYTSWLKRELTKQDKKHNCVQFRESPTKLWVIYKNIVLGYLIHESDVLKVNVYFQPDIYIIEDASESMLHSPPPYKSFPHYIS